MSDLIIRAESQILFLDQRHIDISYRIRIGTRDWTWLQNPDFSSKLPIAYVDIWMSLMMQYTIPGIPLQCLIEGESLIHSG